MVTSTKIGRVEIRAFVDFAPPPFAPTDFFPDVPLAAWEPHRHHHALDADGKFRTNFGFFSVQSDDFHVIVDTGSGGPSGKLPDELRNAGIDPASITAVVNTHLHGDHVGWNLTDGKPTFPNARYIVSRVDWEHWTSANVIGDAPHMQAQALPLQEQGILDLSDDGYEVAAGLRILSTPGHTPGHQSLLIESDGRKGIVAGDVIHSRAQITEPEWCAGFDMDKPTAVATRKAFIERALAEQLTVAAGHLLLDTNIGVVVELEERRYWKAL